MTRSEFFQAAGVPYRSEPCTFVTARQGIRPVDLLPQDNFILLKPGAVVFTPETAIFFSPSKKRGKTIKSKQI
jgi:hypothetical protein